jgi:hypothetical protein
MVMASLAWTLKAWTALLVPVSSMAKTLGCMISTFFDLYITLVLGTAPVRLFDEATRADYPARTYLDNRTIGDKIMVAA